MTPHQAITKRVHPMRQHLIHDDATLESLGLALVDLWGIAADLEEAGGFMFRGDPEHRWATVGDVVRAVEDMREGV